MFSAFFTIFLHDYTYKYLMYIFNQIFFSLFHFSFFSGQPAGKLGSAVQMQPNGIQSLNQLSALNQAAAAGYRMPGVNQLTASQLQQLASQQAMTNQQLQQLMRSGLLGNPQQQQQQAASRPQQQQQQRQSSSASNGNKPFPTKLTQIKEFPIERSNQPPYKLQKALIDNKIVPCINVRPFVFHDLMMTLPGMSTELSFLTHNFLHSSFYRLCETFLPRLATRKGQRNVTRNTESYPLQRQQVDSIKS